MVFVVKHPVSSNTCHFFSLEKRQAFPYFSKHQRENSALFLLEDYLQLQLIMIELKKLGIKMLIVVLVFCLLFLREKKMKIFIKSFVISISILLLCSLTYAMTAHIGMDHSLIIDNIEYKVSESDNSLKAGYGFMCPSVISNLPTEGEGEDRAVFSLSTAKRTTTYYSSELPRNDYEVTLFQRTTENIYGEEVLKYKLDADINLYEDEGILVALTPSGGGHGGYSVEFRVISFSENDFSIEVSELIFGDQNSFIINAQISEENKVVLSKG